MVHGRGSLRFSTLRLVFWACCLIWLGLLSPSSEVAVSVASAGLGPYTVLISLAHEHDLGSPLSPVSKREDTFNGRHLYDWVSFSARPLSEQFRRLKSNATNATCIYEVVENKPWSVAGGVQGPEYALAWLQDDNLGKPTPLMCHICRWKSGSFAKENRLKACDWLWIIEPGAQFTRDIEFDVFQAMRDHGIAYGSNKAGVAGAHLRKLSPYVKQFVDENSGLVHVEADLSWLLESGDGGDDFNPEAGDAIVAQDYEIVMAKPDTADGWRDDGVAGNHVSTPIEAFASRLGSIYRSSLWLAFDRGSLAFLRSQSHQALFEQLDTAGDVYYRGLHEASTPTLSATMFLPQDSVVRLGVGGKRNAKAAGERERKLLKETLADWHALWAQIASDFAEQGGMPGLRSGSTVVDELNFVLDTAKPMPKPKPVRLSWRMADDSTKAVGGRVDLSEREREGERDREREGARKGNEISGLA